MAKNCQKLIKIMNILLKMIKKTIKNGQKKKIINCYFFIYYKIKY